MLKVLKVPLGGLLDRFMTGEVFNYGRNQIRMHIDMSHSEVIT